MVPDTFPPSLLYVKVGGVEIGTTAEHPFRVRGQGWTAAIGLKPGDRLVGHDGNELAVEAVRADDKSVLVYNLRIADYHTYFVGSRWEFSVWAHNAEECAKLAVFESMSRNSGLYQRFATGTRAGWAWLARTGEYFAKFDGFRKGIFLEAKGSGYAKLLTQEATKYNVAQRLVDQAWRQLHAAGGTPIRWLFEEKKAADIVRELFQEWKFGIDAIHLPW
jgi:hypothetical protein